jgi:hypothetical protein
MPYPQLEVGHYLLDNNVRQREAVPKQSDNMLYQEDLIPYQLETLPLLLLRIQQQLESTQQMEALKLLQALAQWH